MRREGKKIKWISNQRWRKRKDESLREKGEKERKGEREKGCSEWESNVKLRPKRKDMKKRKENKITKKRKEKNEKNGRRDGEKGKEKKKGRITKFDVKKEPKKAK